MKKTLVLVFIVAAFLSACNELGNKAETQDAKVVEQVVTGQEMMFTQLDPSSQFNWKASHLGGIQPRFGQIKIKEAEIKVSGQKITNAKFVINMHALSVESFVDDKDSENKLTGHLLSADFFNVELYPNSVFELTSIESHEAEFNSLVTGNLTILDVTKSISFKANVTIKEAGVKIASEDFTVDRRDWGLSYNTEGTAGVPTDYLIADEIGFSLDLKITQ